MSFVFQTYVDNLKKKDKFDDKVQSYALRYAQEKILNDLGNLAKEHILEHYGDINGNIVVTYKYDAWGNHKVYDSSNAENTSSSFIGNINPFRYKGYYYDVETEWYYLQSRYYSPFFSRFVSMDHIDNLEPSSFSNIDLFSYCGNNPVMYFDENGNKWWKKALTVIAIAAVVTIVVIAIVASAGGAAALAGVGVSLLGASAATASTVVTATTVLSYVVAGGIALIGANEAYNVATGKNIIRDEVMGGNQTAYDITKYSLIAAGALIITAGTVAPYVLKNSFTNVNFDGHNLDLKNQNPNAIITNTRTGGFQTNIFDKLGNWVCRIDAYIHRNHVNPHVHFGNPNNDGIDVRTLWKAIKHLFGL